MCRQLQIGVLLLVRNSEKRKLLICRYLFKSQEGKNEWDGSAKKGNIQNMFGYATLIRNREKGGV